MPLINGTANNDNLTGTDLADDINGLAGNDSIQALDGADVIHGGDGNDTIYAGAGGFVGIDWIYDEAGDDVVFGGTDMDIMYGSAGNDTYDGGTGTTGAFGLDLDSVDYVGALAGIVVDLRLSSGQVRSVGGLDAAAIGVDTLLNVENIYGSNFNDSMRASDGFQGNATLYGQGGDDTLTGGTGADVLSGGAGDDLIDGGGGADMALYRLSQSGVVVSLLTPGAQDTGEGIDTLISIEDLWGSTHNDLLIGNAGANWIFGDSGNDIIVGGAGNDFLEGHNGDDVYVFESGADHAFGEIEDSGGIDEVRFAASAPGTLTLFATDEGIDRVVIGTGLGTVAVTTGVTALNVDARAVANGIEIIGNDGTNQIQGTAFGDRIHGGAGNDQLFGGAGNDQLIGGAGDDELYGESSDDLIADNDGGSDILDGGAGNDVISLYRLNQSLNETAVLRGGDGNDDITSWSYASGNVSIDGGTGDDRVRLFSSNNSHDITLGPGRDVLDLGPYQPLQGIGQTSRTVSDFQTGTAGDTVLLYNLLSGYGAWDGQSDPFATGVIRLIQRGADAVLQMSGVGGSPSFIDLLVFQNVSAQSFLAENLGGFSPNGVPAAPVNLTGDSGFNSLVGGYGDDIIDGLGGSDIIDGLAGNDVLRGGDGDDHISAGFGNDIVEGGAGNDFVEFQHDGGSDSVDTGIGDDWMLVYRNFRDVVEHISIAMGDGNDQLRYQNFDDGTLNVTFGAGADRFILLGTRQDVSLTLGANADVVDFSENYTFSSLIGEMVISVADYVPGEDSLQWGSYLQNDLIGWIGSSNAFATGHLRLEQQPGKTVLFIDRDGSGTDFAAIPFLILGNVSLNSLLPGDFAGSNPDGTRDVHNDFNGDGRSDILWQHSNGTVTNWLGQAHGGMAGNIANLGAGAGAGWSIAGTGDFNGDGRDDILWQHSNGTVTDWLGQANGGMVGNFANFRALAGSGWAIAGTGDFNGDGRDDILWQHTDGTVTNWLGQANGGMAGNIANLGAGAGAGWSIAGIGDFNGDGRDDILWQHTDGTVTNWLGQANGGMAGNIANLGAGAGAGWAIAGIGDFNGDGRDDILWQHTNGTVTNWLGQANGGMVGNIANLGAGAGAGWHIAGTGDFNGDGRDDILWQHDNGTVTNWLGQANGGMAGNMANLGMGAGAGWHIAGTGDFNSLLTAWDVQNAYLFGL